MKVNYVDQNGNDIEFSLENVNIINMDKAFEGCTHINFIPEMGFLNVTKEEIEKLLNECKDDRVLGTVIPQSKEELLECIQNLMGVFDTPISRRAINNDIAEEVRKIGREILESNGKSTYDL